MPGILITKDTLVTLKAATEKVEGEEMTSVPNVKDMSMKKAMEILVKSGLSIDISGGGGFSVSQEPEAGTVVEKGTTVTVEFEHEQ
jgi:beta-lactam-binding protein with PASTA domain